MITPETGRQEALAVPRFWNTTSWKLERVVDTGVCPLWPLEVVRAPEETVLLTHGQEGSRRLRVVVTVKGTEV